MTTTTDLLRLPQTAGAGAPAVVLGAERPAAAQYERPIGPRVEWTNHRGVTFVAFEGWNATLLLDARKNYGPTRAGLQHAAGLLPCDHPDLWPVASLARAARERHEAVAR